VPTKHKHHIHTSIKSIYLFIYRLFIYLSIYFYLFIYLFISRSNIATVIHRHCDADSLLQFLEI